MFKRLSYLMHHQGNHLTKPFHSIMEMTKASEGLNKIILISKLVIVILKNPHQPPNYHHLDQTQSCTAAGEWRWLGGLRDQLAVWNKSELFIIMSTIMLTVMIMMVVSCMYRGTNWSCGTSQSSS